MVHHGQRHHLEVGHNKRFGGDFGDVQRWHSRVGYLGETIGHPVAQVAGHIGAAVYREAVAHGAVRSQVVHSAHVVIMAVCDHQRFEHRTAAFKHLLSEIRSAVDQYVFVLVCDHGRRSETLVVFVAALAGGTVAHYLGHSGAGACAKESEFHRQ